MKKRIKIDSAILSFVIILTGILYLYRNIYGPHWLDNILDFLGVLVILEGTMLRMWARGHKKAKSQQSQHLVMTGPYALVRNPMYLGSFLLGAGFVLVVWPWWSLPIFAGLFYSRFIKTIKKEEAILSKQFDAEYEKYCKKVPRLFPHINKIFRKKIKTFNLQEAFSTHEKRGLIGWPLMAFCFEIFQEGMVYGQLHFQESAIIVGGAALAYLFFLILYLD